MANRWSVASGLASAASTWDGGASVPVSGDRVLISAGTTVTLDGTYEWGDDSTATISVNGVSTTASITVQAGGTLQHSTSVSSQLTTFGGMNVFGTYNAGTAATPMPQGVTATLIVGRQTTPVADRIYADFLDGSGASFVGVTRKRLTTLTATANAAATSIAVTNATGWQVGDELYICQTDSGGDKRYDIGVIAAGYVSGNLTVPLTAALGFQHLSGCDVANMTSNVTAKSYYSTAPHAGMTFRCGPTGTSNQRDFSHAAFENFYGRYNRQGVTIECIDNVGNGNENFSATPWANSFSRIDSCAFVRRSTTDQYVFCPMGKTFDVPLSITNCFVGHANKTAVGQIYFEGAPTFNGCLFAGIFTHGSARPCYITNSVFNGCVDAVNQACIFTQGVAVGNLTVSNTKFYGRTGCATVNYGTATVISNYVFDNCDIGYTFPIGASTLRLTNSQTNNATMAISYVSCRFQASLLSTPTTIFSSPPALTAVSQIDIVNRDTDVTKQEIHKRDWSVYRDTTTNRSVSSIKITPKALSTNCTRTQSIACANGASIRVVGYVRRVTGTTTATVTISGTIAGVSITTQTFTASAASIGAWERYVLVATNTTGNDGNLTLTYTANASSLTTPDVYFDGVTDAPFVTKARHFGFLYDESLPTRTVNQTVTLTNYTPTATSLGTDETTAIGIGGMTVTGGVSVSPLALTASRTFQQVYDYTQAWGAANLTSALPLTGVGIAGSPSLFAAANVTTTGFTLNGSGSLSMGAYTLTANQPWAYTYTGGTFSQASTVPTFAGGTLIIGNGGTYTFTQASSMTVSVTPAGNTSYTFSAGSFTGTLTVNNTTGTTVTVYVPAGVTTVATGGPVIFSAPIVQQQVVISGFVAGSRIQIYDTTNSVELFNGTASAGNTIVSGSTATWTDPSAAVGTRAIRVRISYVSGVTATAKKFVEANIGTCGVTSPSNAISYLVNQTNDTTYIANNVIGSAVTGVTFTDAATDLVNCNIAGGAIKWGEIYAAFVYWNFTAAGIANNFTYIDAPDAAHYILSGMKVKNTSAVPLDITNGWGRDATTNKSRDVVDFTGGYIFLTPDTVESYQTTGTYAITGDPASVAAAVRTNLTTELGRIDVAVSTRNATTPPTASAIATQVLSAAATTPIDANVKKFNDVTVIGTGTAGDLWRG